MSLIDEIGELLFDGPAACGAALGKSTSDHADLACKFKMKKQMCTVRPYHILAERFGLFAMRLPSLSQGKWTVGMWHNF